MLPTFNNIVGPHPTNYAYAFIWHSEQNSKTGGNTSYLVWSHELHEQKSERPVSSRCVRHRACPRRGGKRADAGDFNVGPFHRKNCLAVPRLTIFPMRGDRHVRRRQTRG